MGKYTDRDGELHDKGQTDYSNNKYDPPHGIISSSNSRKNAEEQEAYDAGYEHAKSQDHSGSCFLTSACVAHAGLPDDCRQLTVLRSFRDRYVATLPNGADVLAEYYALAPSIVRIIERSPDRDAEFKTIFGIVNDAVMLIERGKMADAFKRYEMMMSDLKERFLS